MNSINFIGRLAKDPEITKTENYTICKFPLAVSRGKDKRANFFTITVFGNQAEQCQKWLKKGSQVGISGYVEENVYEKNGEKNYIINFIATLVEFLGKKNSQEDKESVPEGFDEIGEDVPF